MKCHGEWGAVEENVACEPWQRLGAHGMCIDLSFVEASRKSHGSLPLQPREGRWYAVASSREPRLFCDADDFTMIEWTEDRRR